MEEIFEVLKEFENEGITIECGWKEKERKKRMSKAMKKIKESGDENKIKLAKRLARYYGIFHNMGPITTCPNFPYKEDKYGLHYVHIYLEGFVDTAKRSIAGVIKALADDEELDPFCKYLMVTYLYTPKEVKEIRNEEIYERKKNLEKDLGLCNSDHDDGDNVGIYTPKEVKEIRNEEIYERKKNLEKDLGLCNSDHDDGDNVGRYEISGFLLV